MWPFFSGGLAGWFDGAQTILPEAFITDPIHKRCKELARIFGGKQCSVNWLPSTNPYTISVFIPGKWPSVKCLASAKKLLAAYFTPYWDWFIGGSSSLLSWKLLPKWCYGSLGAENIPKQSYFICGMATVLSPSIDWFADQGWSGRGNRCGWFVLWFWECGFSLYLLSLT